ncbi:hypothetical protein CVT24_008299 [Panaeolus cyanescens]|uniref:Uncharacterized protein n=1 Tax=Panaeolus cyanescens TaxID=181874 RepID=A0A409WZP0_9AGAR|nr:hypothetical protein CVT24_008299 [Panaeolus cyanescens]
MPHVNIFSPPTPASQCPQNHDDFASLDFQTTTCRWMYELLSVSRTYIMANPSKSILLAHRNPTAPLTAYDGKVGALIGKYIYTTPNETFIPHPPIGNRHVRVREDYRFGPDDHTLWPQPYSSTYPHLGAIPRRPEDVHNALSIMWYDPLQADFDPVEGGIVDGIGKLNPTLLASKIEPLVQSLQNRFDQWYASIPGDKPVKKFVGVLERAMHYTLIRLKAHIATWHHIRFSLTELQRYYLELLGCLNYLEIYKPHMDSQQSSLPPLANCLGVYTNQVRVVEEFVAAGLPVWFTRECTASGFGNNVLAEVVPKHFYGTLNTEPHKDFAPLFSGETALSSSEVVGLVHKFSRQWTVSADPFEDTPEASPPNPTPAAGSSSRGQMPQPSSAPTQGSSIRPQSQPPRKKHKPNPSSSTSSGAKQPGKAKNPTKLQRNKFHPLEGPFVLYSIPAWADVLRNVDQTQPPVKEGLVPRHFCYGLRYGLG